jgi:hypothetical protein
MWRILTCHLGACSVASVDVDRNFVALRVRLGIVRLRGVVDAAVIDADELPVGSAEGDIAHDSDALLIQLPLELFDHAFLVVDLDDDRITGDDRGRRLSSGLPSRWSVPTNAGWVDGASAACICSIVG